MGKTMFLPENLGTSFVVSWVLLNIWYVATFSSGERGYKSGFLNGFAWALVAHFAIRVVLRIKGSGHLDTHSSLNNINWSSFKTDQVMGDAEQIISWIRRVLYGEHLKESFYTLIVLFVLKTVFNRFVGNFVGIWLCMNCMYISIFSGRFEPRYLWRHIQNFHDILDGIYDFSTSFWKQ